MPGDKYLNPKTDITFNRLFGLQRNTDITIAFLNAVLKLEGDDIITKVTIIDPNNHPELEKKRRSIVDIRCSDKKKSQYIIEMQVVDKKNFAERCQYYVAKSLADQLNVTQNFKKLKPVIFIGVLGDFTIDPDDHFVCHHNLRNVTTNERVLKHMDFYFLELKKFKKTETQLVTPIDRWAFMLNQASELESVPVQLQNDKPIQHAFQELDRVGWTQEDLENYRQALEILHEDENAKEAWLESGMQQGRDERSLEIARNLLAQGSTIEFVAKVTGLARDDIKKLNKL